MAPFCLKAEERWQRLSLTTVTGSQSRVHEKVLLGWGERRPETMSLRTVGVVGVLLLLATPGAVADPVADAYTGIANAADALDAAASQALDALAGSATSVAEGALGASQPLVASAQSALGEAGGALPSASGEWLATGSADAVFELGQGTYECKGMNAVVEHRKPMSNEPSFVLSLMAGQGQPSSLCTSGMRNTFKVGQWSGDAEQGWFAAQYNTPDADVIEVTIGPELADGSRALSVFWVTNNDIVGVFHIQGTLREAVALA